MQHLYHMDTSMMQTIGYFPLCCLALRIPLIAWLSAILNYKITKIVRVLWLAERRVFAWDYVNVVVTSRCFAFRALITQARIWKSFWVENSTSLLHLPIPYLKLGKSLQTYCVGFYFCLSWHLKREKSVFWKASRVCKTRTDYGCKTSCTRLRGWLEFLF